MLNDRRKYSYYVQATKNKVPIVFYSYIVILNLIMKQYTLTTDFAMHHISGGDGKYWNKCHHRDSRPASGKWLKRRGCLSVFNVYAALFPFLTVNINKHNASWRWGVVLLGRLLFLFIRICFCVCGPAKVFTVHEVDL